MPKKNKPQNSTVEPQTSNTLNTIPEAEGLTNEQRARIRHEQEEIMRKTKGEEYAYRHALYVIHITQAYRPQYTRIQDYALAEHGMIRRTWNKMIVEVKANEAARAYLKRIIETTGSVPDHFKKMCPNGHAPAGQILSREQSKIFEPFLKRPQMVEAIFNESAQQPTDKHGRLVTSTMQTIATKYHQQMESEKLSALTAQPIGERYKDWFVVGDMLTTPAIKKDHFDMVITSPPYDMGIKYANDYNDNISATEYLKRLEEWAGRIRWTLKTTGSRAAINLPCTWHNEEAGSVIHALPAELYAIMKRFGDMHLMDWLTWDRLFLTDVQDKHWGSYHSCTNPSLRRRTEAILIFGKGSTSRKETRNLYNTTEAGFKSWTYDIWGIVPEGNKRQLFWHPCPFPLDIPVRLMLIYGQRHDKILDPFGGSGTTALAAAMLDRECISVELPPSDPAKDYTELGRRRLIDFMESGKAEKRLAKILKRAEDDARGKLVNWEGEPIE